MSRTRTKNTTRVQYYRNNVYMGVVSNEQAGIIIDAARKEGSHVIHEFNERESTIKIISSVNI